MILVINGPNLNLLGERKTDVYGSITLKEINSNLRTLARDLGVEILCFQSNHEGEIIDFLHKHRRGAAGLIINPGAFTHYSYAVRDAIEAIDVPSVEVHISDIYSREEFRKESVIEPVVTKQITGKGVEGYYRGLDYLVGLLKGDEKQS